MEHPTNGPTGRIVHMGRMAATCVLLALASAPLAHSATNVVEYGYDAAGNIVSIQRAFPGALAVSGFTPGRGPAGTTVVIDGTGFSPTAASDVVTFGGVVAPVIAASATSLSVAVPATATTGRIAVAV